MVEKIPNVRLGYFARRRTVGGGPPPHFSSWGPPMQFRRNYISEIEISGFMCSDVDVDEADSHSDSELSYFLGCFVV